MVEELVQKIVYQMKGVKRRPKRRAAELLERAEKLGVESFVFLEEDIGNCFYDDFWNSL